MDIDSEDEEERKGPMRQPKSYARPPRRPVVTTEEVTEVIDLSDDEEPEKQEVNKAEENKPETEDSSLEKRQAGEPETEESPPEKKIKVIDTGEDEKKVAEVANVSPVKEHTEIRSGEEQTEEAKPEPLSQTEIVTGETEEREIAELRKENKEIKIQLETLKKEEASMKEKETQIKALQLAFVNVQQQLKETKAKLKNEEESRKARESELTVNLGTDAEKATESSNDPEMSRKEGALMSFICIFLHAHPFGASIDYLYSYLSRLQPNIAHSEIDGILHRYPNCFVEELSGVGASLERRWKFVAFEDALKKS